MSTIFQQLENSGATQGFTQKLQRKLGRQVSKLLLRSSATVSALKPPTADELDFNDPLFLMAEVPAMNGVFTARGLAKLYTIFAMPNEERHLALINRKRREEIQTVQSTCRDRVLHVPMHWRLGYHRILNFKIKAPFGFGHFGYGGSGGWCDPSRHISVGYTLNTLWGSPVADYRMAQLAGEILSSIDKLNFEQNKTEHSLNS
jgi:CubicO group peptidase (beta-lactamase class C family)